MAIRIFSQIEHSSEEERSYYQREAEKLGYSTFSAFVRDAMKEKIRSRNPLLPPLQGIIGLCNDAELWLQEIKDPSAEEAETLKILRLIEQLVARAQVMQNAEENYINVPEAMLDEGEIPHKEYRYAVVSDEIADKFFGVS